MHLYLYGQFQVHTTVKIRVFFSKKEKNNEFVTSSQDKAEKIRFPDRFFSSH